MKGRFSKIRECGSRIEFFSTRMRGKAESCPLTAPIEAPDDGNIPKGLIERSSWHFNGELSKNRNP